MLFNSIVFAFFLPLVFVLYWGMQDRLPLKAQNFLILVASYVFYGWWDWRFLSLIFISSVVDYIAGLKIHGSDNPRTRKAFLALSLLMNLGALGFFKYFNFFVDSFVEMTTIRRVSGSITRTTIIGMQTATAWSPRKL